MNQTRLSPNIYGLNNNKKDRLGFLALVRSQSRGRIQNRIDRNEKLIFPDNLKIFFL